MPATIPQAVSGPAVTLRAASGATVLFITQNGQVVGGVDRQQIHLPHLVLHRNGALTGPAERTLIVEVTGIEVSPPGVTVTLRVETQHGDPDLGGDDSNRIVVWQESKWIANGSGATQTGVTVAFGREFGAALASGSETVATPTDYFRYHVAVVDADHPGGAPLHAFGADHAFLMEDQWAVPLPPVQETSESAAPDELVVYACDMFPFQKNRNDPTTWLPRQDVPHYVQAELIPRMVEAFRAQTDDWGFPWHDAWTSFRSWEETEQLGVALAESETWFHGPAPSWGNATISIGVDGGENAHYEALADGLTAIFHHELFHNLQRNISQHSGGSGDVDGEQNGWQFFSEGMAVLASSIAQPPIEFSLTERERTYMFNTNSFVGGGGLLGDLNRSYAEMKPYHAAMYWRFLYEKCGGMQNSVENPAAGMQVIKRTLAALYSEEIVDIDSSSDIVGQMPQIMDHALEGSACPFRTHRESLTAFASAIYALQLENSRCTAPGLPTGCGFYDPQSLYSDPPSGIITYAGTQVSYAEVDQAYPAGIKSSFGFDFVDVILAPAANGQPLTVEFHGAPGAAAEFHVQIWRLMDAGKGARPHRVPAPMAAPEVLTWANGDGHLFYTISAIDTAAYNRLGLIITRVDARESADPVGAYTIVLRGDAGNNP
jgi:hypothetical protein